MFLLAIYTGTTLQYIPQLRYLDIDPRSFGVSPLLFLFILYPKQNNSTSALHEPLFITVGFACNFLLVAGLPSP